MPQVTVAISVFNGADELPRAVESALNQSFKDIEVVILDDGSTDETWQVCEQLAQTDSRLRIYRQENAGRGSALRRLVDGARGEWVALLDHDDWWEPEKLERQLEHLKEPNVLVHTDGWFHYPGRVQDRRIVGAGRADILPHNRVIASSAVFRRSAMVDAGNFHQDLWAACDWYGWLLLIGKGNIVHLPQQLVHYEVREGSIANRGFRFQSGKRHMLKELLLPQWTQVSAPLEARTREALLKTIWWNIGVCASTMAKYLDEQGRSKEAAPLHREALRLSPKVPRVWTRFLKHVLLRGK
jgi:glycosyltransferase involved in cell wall biosynthesis